MMQKVIVVFGIVLYAMPTLLNAPPLPSQQSLKQLVTKAESEDLVVRHQAIRDICKELEQSQRDGTRKQLVNELFRGYGILALDECLSNDRVINKDINGNQTLQLPVELVTDAARALELITAQCPEKVAKWDILSYSYKWLGNPKYAGNGLLKHLLSIIWHLADKGLISHEPYTLKPVLPLTLFDNREVAKIAVRICHRLIIQQGEIEDYVKVEHIVNIVRVLDDVTFLFPLMNNSENDSKMTEKILLAFKILLENPTTKDEKLIKQLDQCRDQNKTFFAMPSVDQIDRMHKVRSRFSIAPTKAGPLFRDIANSEAKKVLEETVGLQLLHPNPSKMFSAPPIAILLFGASGTGKASLAKAVANEAGAILYSLSASVIMAKEERDAIALVKMLFQLAKNSEPSAVIFIDQIDELLGRETDTENLLGSGDTENEELLRFATKQRARAEFLVQMDNCCSSYLSSSSSANAGHHHRVLVIGATNQPWVMNENVLKRFTKRIYVEMPDQAAREQMLRKIVQENPRPIIELDESQITKLANETENYSFDELLALCQTISLSSGHAGRAKDVHVQPFTSEENVKKLKEFAKTHHSVNCQMVPTI